MSHIQHFLLVYDHAQGRLVDTIEFGTDYGAAIKRYGELETEHWGNPQMDIVLVGSDSLETIKVTHRNYFDETRTMADILAYLQGVLDEARRSVAAH